MAAGVAIKIGIGAFFVWASSQMGVLAQEILGRVRESVQASELVTLDNHLAVWAIERRRTRAPKNQQEFDRVVVQLFTQRGGRKVTDDRWGMPYLYEQLSARPVGWRIVSRGPDRKPGTKDDLVLERHGDQVHINKDPTEIAEKAIERKRALDEKLLRKMRDLADKAQQVPAEPSSVVKDEKEVGLERQQREALQKALKDLDRMLVRKG